LIGSILSNMLLVLGMSFMIASLKKHQSMFNAGGTGANITCLALASLALTLPTVFDMMPGTNEEDGLMLSRIVAIVMAGVYVAFLVFQLGTHSVLFESPEEQQDSLLGGGPQHTEPLVVRPCVALTMLILTTLSVVYCSDYLVKSISGVSTEYGMPTAFIGLILLPIVGNAAEHTTAVTAAYHDMMDLSLGVAIGSSTQIALFVIPFSIICGWVMDVPLDLTFGLFCTTVFVLSVFIASGMVSDGVGNWFEGFMLLATYGIVGIVTWFLPDETFVHPRLLIGAAAGASPELALSMPPLLMPQSTALVI